MNPITKTISKKIASWLASYLPIFLLGLYAAMVANLFMFPAHGKAANRMEEAVQEIKYSSNEITSYLLSFLSSKMQSPAMQLKMGGKMLDEGDPEGARELLSEAVRNLPTLGMDAAIMTIEHIKSEQDIAYAEGYLEIAAKLSGRSDAARMLGYLALLEAPQDWDKAIKWFVFSAKHGDGFGQLIAGLAYGLGLKEKQNYKAMLAYLLLAEASDSITPSGIAAMVLEESSAEPDVNQYLTDKLWIAQFPSRVELCTWISTSLDNGIPNVISLQFKSINTMPEACQKTKRETLSHNEFQWF